MTLWRSDIQFATQRKAADFSSLSSSQSVHLSTAWPHGMSDCAGHQTEALNSIREWSTKVWVQRSSDDGTVYAQENTNFRYSQASVTCKIMLSAYDDAAPNVTTRRAFSGWALTGVNSRAPQGDGAQQEKPEHPHHPSAQEVEERRESGALRSHGTRPSHRSPGNISEQATAKGPLYQQNHLGLTPAQHTL